MPYFTIYSIKFLVLCLGIWWPHEIWMSQILNFDFLDNNKSFWSEIKTFFLVSQVPSFRVKKQTSKNVADTTFKHFLICCRKICRMLCRNVDECSGYNCRITWSLLNKAWITIILKLFMLHYVIVLYYIIFIIIYIYIIFIIFLIIYNLFKGSNGKVKLERSRLWQLDNSWRKACERGWWWRW